MSHAMSLRATGAGIQGMSKQPAWVETAAGSGMWSGMAGPLRGVGGRQVMHVSNEQA